ncbi:phage major capsid protein, P2 family [Pantoea agglomerans]|uniref:phage major capsid protein, P2 family n=1 Tax=Enterobacter agglomerans TaxID=549 RepID=UPI001F249FA4|nr:phage major capsid protein, P2 family [Pantoea agglomerans]UJL36644.1 phage major capsid protein, P2 family [Pantoea agglomerans]
MKNTTRFKLNAYMSVLAEINKIDLSALNSKFTIEPSVSQTLESKIQESSAFLQAINIMPVSEQSGERLGLGIGTTIAGTTDTTQKEREPTDPTYIDGDGYKCTQTNFDTALPYSKLDMWAKFSDFQVRIRDAIVKRQALDRIMIGFNGLKREKTSNRVQNPLLQDVNIGWLEKIRQEKPAQVLGQHIGEDGKVVSEKITVGKNGLFRNLDAVVMGAVSEKIGVQYQDDTELVVICGRQLLADKYFPLVNQSQPNTEALAADLIISQKRIGGLQAVRAPYFPANALLITRLDNLSIYWQEETRRRSIIDNPKRDRIENLESVNEAYVVEDYDCTCLVENIELLEQEPEKESGEMSEAEIARIAAVAASVVKSMSGAGDSTGSAGANQNAGA